MEIKNGDKTITISKADFMDALAEIVTEIIHDEIEADRSSNRCIGTLLNLTIFSAKITEHFFNEDTDEETEDED